jgi:tetratricopeptide (TPR) repeat protein
MTDHPPSESFAALIAGNLDRGEQKRVIRHLIAGCADCGDAAASAYRVLEQRGFATAPRYRPETYEFPVRYALRSARASFARLEREREVAAREVAAALESDRSPLRELSPGEAAGVRGWARAETLLKSVERVRAESPARAFEVARLAVEAATRLDVEAHPAGLVADLRCRTWAEMGNAQRLIGDLVAAERSLVAAQEHLAEGTGAPGLAADLLDRGASLRIDQRRFAEAEEMLDRLIALRRAEGRPSQVGKALVLQGLAAIYGEDPGVACSRFLAALEELDPVADGRLMFIALHNLVECEIELNRFEEARRAQRSLAPLYERHAREMDLLKRRVHDGKIAAGLDDLGSAEAIFRECRAAYGRHGMPFYVALADLDLAAVWVRQGRFAEVYEVADQLVGSFAALGIGREALASFLLLREAARNEKATTALIRKVVTEVVREARL